MKIQKDGLPALYAQLNEQQRRAVEKTEGPVLVFAGPGTGKTQILTARIARLLEHGVQPGNILALTFTNAGAKNMQERLASMVGSVGYQVTLSTFHSFANGVIDQFSHVFPRSIQSGGLVAELDQFEIVQDVLVSGDFSVLRPSGEPLYYLRSIVSLLTSYKREGVDPTQLANMAQEELELLEDFSGPARERSKREKIAQKNAELAKIYEAYQKALTERGMFDYEDVILWVRDGLRSNPELSQEYQERYQYILVDEFQDTNQSQFQLLLELCSFWGSEANVFAVGDPNQSIYRFQGASVSNVLQFLQLFPNAELISLQEGYRCPPEIYEHAAEMISQNELTDLDPRLASLEQPLHSTKVAAGASIHVRSAANPLLESVWLAHELQKQHDAGVPWSEMAVLYRNHSQSVEAERVLRAFGIPIISQKGENSLAQPFVQGVLRMLHLLIALRENTDTDTWASVLFLPWWSVDPTEALKILRAARTHQEAKNSVWWILEHPETWSALGIESTQYWMEFANNFAKWHAELHQEPVKSLERILSESGVFSLLWSNTEWQSQLPSILALLREAQQWSQRHPTARMKEFLQRLESMQQHGFTLVPEYISGSKDAVTLCTAHSAKGREWEFVYLLRVNDGVWSNTRERNLLPPLENSIPYAQTSEKEKLEDDRRLFYVAVTRAKTRVTLLTCDQVVEREKIKELVRSPFLLEFAPHVEVVPIEAVSPEQLQSLTPATTEALLGSVDTNWLLDLAQNFSVSYSALDTYLRCPAQFFFQYFIRTPQVPTVKQSVGEISHAVLEEMNRVFSQRGTLLSDQEIIQRVQERSQKVFLPSEERLVAAQQAEALLLPYVAAKRSDWLPSLKTEHFFGKSPPLEFLGMKLVGKVDSIHSLSEKAVRVVDYKTGKRRTKGELLGKPEDRVQAVRQLVFYALLADLDPTFNQEVTEGEFVFLQPTPAGKFTSVVFEITSERKQELEAVLEQFQKDLVSLQFLTQPPCGECEVCTKVLLPTRQ